MSLLTVEEFDNVSHFPGKLTRKQKKTERFIKSPIGVVPSGGYTHNDCFSKKSILWLELIAKRKGVRIQHALNGGEFLIPGTNYRVDGYTADDGTLGSDLLFEYHGCLYHGCVQCTGTHKRPEWGLDDVSYKQRYAMTVSRSKKLREMGYRLIEIWEHQADAQMKNITPEEKLYLENLDFVSRLNMRDSLFGGRTNAIRLYCETDGSQVIKYFDVTSLYFFPSVEPVQKMEA